VGGRMEVCRVDAMGRRGGDGDMRLALDERRSKPWRGTVNGARLTGGAGGVVVLIVARRATRLHVDRRTILPTLGQRREGDRELRRRRQQGEDGEEPATAPGSGWCEVHLLSVRVSLPKR
jgi:hypothetical protein